MLVIRGSHISQEGTFLNIPASLIHWLGAAHASEASVKCDDGMYSTASGIISTPCSWESTRHLLIATTVHPLCQTYLSLYTNLSSSSSMVPVSLYFLRVQEERDK